MTSGHTEAEAAARESEARWRTLAEVDPNGILVMDDRSVILAANPAVERIFGHPADELVGQPMSVLIPERFREAHRAGVERYLATGVRHVSWSGVELVGLTRSGREIPVEIAFGEYVEGGQHVFAGFVHDLTERKRDEARRAAEHGVTRALAMNAPPEAVGTLSMEAVCEALGWELGAFWIPDAAMDRLVCVAVWHRADEPLVEFARASRTTTLAPGEGLPGRVWRDARALWLRDVLRDPNFPRARAAAEVGLHAAFAVPVTVAAEVEGVMEFFAREIVEPDEALLGTMEVIGHDVGQYLRRRRAERERDRALADAIEARDIAQSQAAQLEEAQAEQEMVNDELRENEDRLRAAVVEAQAARREAEEANRTKSAFLANMSHELRTPINAITGYTDLLEMGIAGPLTDQQADHLNRIKSSTRHLLGLINEVLDLAKVESGQMDVQADRVEVAETVREALDLVGPQAAEQEVELVDRVGSGSGAVYWADSDRVRQILVNLLSNAVKFTRAGGQVSIACRAASTPDPEANLSKEGPWVAIEVEDTGIGVPPEKQRAIFEPFVQADPSHTRERGGTGLGLTISHRLAVLLGGDLTMRSEVGRGSCFTLWLPASSESAEDAGERRAWPRTAHQIPFLSDAGHALARCADDIVRELGNILRGDPTTPGAESLDRAQLDNHTATFLVDIGLALVALDEGGGEPALMRDGTEIQRTVSHLHGAQRARLGWPEAALRREFELLREITDRTLRRALPEAGEHTADAAMDVVARLLEQAERVSLRGWKRAVRHAPAAREAG